MTSSRNPLQTQYILYRQVLETVSSAGYLGGGYLQQPQLEHSCGQNHSQRNRSLGFIKRNIKTKSPQTREMAYQSLVCPQLEYASAVWDPHTKDKTHKVEMVQRRAARWTLSDYARTTSRTSLQSQFNWQTLEERRSVSRLCLFYKIVNGLVAVPLPDYMQPTHRISRYCHSMTFRQIHTGKDYFKY